MLMNYVNNNAQLKCFFVSVAFLDFMGLGVVVAIFPHLLLDGNIFLPHLGHGARLTVLGLFLGVYPLGQFFGAAVLGKMSDIYGRRKLMILTLFGTFIGFTLSAVSIVEQSAILLLLSRGMAGVFAGNVAIAQAGMTDISKDDEKAKNITLIQVSMGLAWVFGPPLGGWLSEVSLLNMPGFTTSFLFMALLLLLLTLYTVFFFKETLANPKTHERIHVFSGILQIIEAFTHKNLRISFLSWGIFVAGWWLFEAFLPVYLLKKFNFSSGEIGNFLASMGATYALFQYIVVNRVIRKIAPETLVKKALLISVFSILCLPFVNNVVQLHIVITLFVTSMGFVLPGIITSISNLANKEEQGEVMGNISSIQALATVLMMMLGGYIDSFGISITIFGGAFLMFLSWLLFVTKSVKVAIVKK